MLNVDQRGANLLLAYLIPIRDFEFSRAILLHLHTILEGIPLLDILRIIWIGQDAQRSHDVARPELLFGEGMAAGAVIDRIGVLVFVDDL